MKTEMRHDESWTITVLPGEGETWPLTRPYITATRDFRPDKLTISLTRRIEDAGQLSQHITLTGHILRKDGTPGARRVSHSQYGTLPAWLADLVARARAGHGLDGKP
jgi:hypothetical protein